MDRKTLLEQLENVYFNIQVTEKIIAGHSNDYYKGFGMESYATHKLEIKKKCLAYWQRRFNRILNELKYN